MKQLLWLLAISGCNGCAAAFFNPAVIILPDSIQVDVSQISASGKYPFYPMGNDAARTGCGHNNVPVIILNPHYAKSPVEGILLVHERRHAAQLAKDCHKTMERYSKDVDFQYRMELEAHCASVSYARAKQDTNPSTWRFLSSVKASMEARFSRSFDCLEAPQIGRWP